MKKIFASALLAVVALGISAPSAQALTYPYYDTTNHYSNGYWYHTVVRDGSTIASGWKYGYDSVGFYPALFRSNYINTYDYTSGKWAYSYFYHTY